MIPDFDPEEIQRYSRHIVLPEVGLSGQARLKAASILIVGAGGLGSPLALYLAAAGVGRIGIVDYDTVDLSNLQRQVIHTTADVGTLKVESARRKMLAINPGIRVDTYTDLLSSENAEMIAAPYDILVDGTDNIPTRYLINDLCVFSGKTYVYGAVSGFFGHVSVFDAQTGPCYRCIFPDPPPPEMMQPCSTAGVLGVMPGIIGLMQANEVIKRIVGIPTALLGQLLLYDGAENSTTKIMIDKNPACKVCGTKPEITTLIDYERFCNTSVRAASYENDDGISINPQELNSGEIFTTPTRIIDLREPIEFQISAIPSSENIPFHHLSEQMKGWDKSQPLILLCHFGFLSSIARQMLMGAGFKNVRNLRGGMQGWLLNQAEFSKSRPQIP